MNDREPCDPDFLLWWEYFRQIQVGEGTLRDVFLASFHWNLSIELQQRLGNLE